MVRKFWLQTVVLALAICGSASAELFPVSDCSRAEPSGERTLCHETIAPASAADVWALWATAEGFSSWAAPVAAVDLRPGGLIETSYDANARIGDSGNIRNRVIAVEPRRLLVIQIADAPPGFPHADAARELSTLIELEALSLTETRVRVSMMGYRSGEDFDALYAFFARGNAWTMEKLRERIAQGPTDWRAERE